MAQRDIPRLNPNWLVQRNRFSPNSRRRRKTGNFELLLLFPFRPAASVSTKTNACYRYRYATHARETHKRAMTTRNRTNQFLRMREQALRYRRPFTTSSPAEEEDGDTERLLSGSNTSTHHAVSVSPIWMEMSEEVTSLIATIKEKTSQLGKAHARAMLVSFDDASNDEHAVEILTQEISRLFRKCEGLVKRLVKADGQSQGDADVKTRKNVQMSHALELQRLTTDFRKQQRRYLEECARRDGTGEAAAGTIAAIFDTAETTGSMVSGTPSLFTESQVLRAKQSEVFIEEREQEVESIARSVNDLAEMMRDLSTLVIDQGSILDRIDYNVEQVAEKVDAGLKELKKAEEHQKSSRMFICILFLVVACVLMLLVLVLKSII